MIGILGLDQHLARQRGAAAAAADLHQLREQPLRRAEVGGEQRGIGADDADQGEQRESRGPWPASACRPGCRPRRRGWRRAAPAISSACSAESRSMRSTRACGKALGERGLPAAACRGRRAAGRGCRSRGRRAGCCASSPQWWQRRRWSARCTHQVRGAAPAARDPAAGRAGQHRRVAAPVEEHQALLAALEPLAQRGEQRARTGRPATSRGACRRSAHVGMASATARSRQFEQAVAPGLRVHGKGFQRGRGRAEHDRDVALLGAPDRDVARRIAQAVLLLEGGVVLFVDDDQLQARQRHEHRQPRAEHDVGAPFRAIEETARARARRPCRCGRETTCAPGKRAATRPSSCGVSAISGTSISAWPPRASTASMARR